MTVRRDTWIRRLLLAATVSALMLAGLGTPAMAAKPLGPPTGLKAQPLSTSQIALSWNAVVGADGYRISRSPTAGGPYTFVASQSGTTFTDKGLTPDTSYYYVVQTHYGFKYSQNSTEASAATPKPVSAPVNFKATSTDSTMDLSWDQVSGADHYEVISVNPDNTEVELATTTDTRFTVTDVVFGHWYWYKIRAVAGLATADSATLYVGVGTPSTTTLSVSPVPSEEGQNVVLTAHVAVAGKENSLYDGDVEFYMDGAYVGRISIDFDDHDAVFQMYGLPAGSHVFYAQYRGEDFDKLGASASTSVDQVTNPAYGGVSFGTSEVHSFGADSDPKSVAIADVTGDGSNDVLMTTQQGGIPLPDTDFRLVVFAQQPDHTLAAPQALSTHGSTFKATMRIATGDLEGDGDTDVVVGGDTGVDVYRQVGGKLIGPTLLPTPDAPVDLVIADMNGDGLADLVVSDATPQTLVYLSQPSGFAEPVQVSGNLGGRVAVADLNGDGRPDVLTAQTFAFTPYTQTATGGFTQQTTVTPPTGGFGIGGISAGDVTGDGRADIALTVSANDPYSRALVYPQTGSGGLGAPTVYGVYDVPEPVALADVDRDGRRDLVIAHGGWYQASVLLQRPDGLLGRSERFRLPNQTSHYDERGLAVGDLNGDGKPDIAVADYLRGLVVLPQL